MNDNHSNISVRVSIWNMGVYRNKLVKIAPGACQFFSASNGIIANKKSCFPGSYRNISKGKQVTADDYWPENLPFSIIDEIDSTSYKSLLLPTASTPQDLVVMLMGTFTCNKLNVKSSVGNGPEEVMVQTSIDGTNYTTATTVSLLNTTDWQTISFANTDATYVRLRMNSSFGAQNVGISEIQLFGSPK